MRLQRSLGTTVVQHADPATLLSAPASEFVAGFVGADLGTVLALLLISGQGGVGCPTRTASGSAR